MRPQAGAADGMPPTSSASPPLARAGSASPGESRARCTFFTWGLPEPELNAPVLDAHGQWLATSDFLWRRARVVGEYDGDIHRTNRRRWQLERERRAAIEDAGYTYVEMTALSFDDPTCRGLRARLTRLLAGVSVTEVLSCPPGRLPGHVPPPAPGERPPGRYSTWTRTA